MNRKISFGAALALLLIVAAFVFSVTMMYATQDFNTRVADLRSRETMYEKYAEIDRLVRLNYNGSISETQLMDNVARGYLAGIGDDYGRYLTAEEYKKLVQDTEGDNVGIGAVIETAPDDFYLLVTEVYPDSPAEVAGIQAGDLIVKIDDTDLTRDNSHQMLDSIQGPSGSKITMVVRSGSNENLVEMSRRAVPTPTVLHTKLLEDSTVGYLYIKDFADRTYDQFNRELLRLLDAGATSLIIDLRDTKSDTLKSMARILDKLLPEGVLVTTSYKDGTTEVLYDSDANEVNLPIVVLTNAGTTGTPELFAQAIKDYEKGRTVGVHTAGKGVMQRIIKLSDGSAIELSVANYLTKSGQSINKTGVKPDFELAMEVDWTKLVEAEGADAQLAKAKEVAIGVERASTNGEIETGDTEEAGDGSGENPTTDDAADEAEEGGGEGDSADE